jgi:hypothetical protein
MSRTIVLPAAVVAAVIAGLAAGPAQAAPAKTCSDIPVSARGEPASFEWIAKTKARANWRAEVRKTTGLGTAYSTWGKAENAEERCISSPEGTYCIFTGYPCRQ